MIKLHAQGPGPDVIGLSATGVAGAVQKRSSATQPVVRRLIRGDGPQEIAHGRSEKGLAGPLVCAAAASFVAVLPWAVLNSPFAFVFGLALGGAALRSGVALALWRSGGLG